MASGDPESGRSFGRKSGRINRGDEGKMATQAEVKQALYDEIVERIDATTSPLGVLQLAEAYAWVMIPNQSHGGSGTPPT